MKPGYQRYDNNNAAGHHYFAAGQQQHRPNARQNHQHHHQQDYQFVNRGGMNNHNHQSRMFSQQGSNYNPRNYNQGSHGRQNFDLNPNYQQQQQKFQSRNGFPQPNFSQNGNYRGSSAQNAPQQQYFARHQHLQQHNNHFSSEMNNMPQTHRHQAFNNNNVDHAGQYDYNDYDQQQQDFSFAANHSHNGSFAQLSSNSSTPMSKRQRQSMFSNNSSMGTPRSQFPSNNRDYTPNQGGNSRPGGRNPSIYQQDLAGGDCFEPQNNFPPQANAGSGPNKQFFRPRNRMYFNQQAFVAQSANNNNNHQHQRQMNQMNGYAFHKKPVQSQYQMHSNNNNGMMVRNSMPMRNPVQNFGPFQPNNNNFVNTRRQTAYNNHQQFRQNVPVANSTTIRQSKDNFPATNGTNNKVFKPKKTFNSMNVAKTKFNTAQVRNQHQNSQNNNTFMSYMSKLKAKNKAQQQHSQKTSKEKLDMDLDEYMKNASVRT